MNVFENLKTGDKVFLCNRSEKKLCEVEKITPKGFIKVDGMLFTKDGLQRGGGDLFFKHIRTASEEEIKEHKKAQYIQSVFYKLRNYIYQITYEQAVEIDRILFSEQDK